MPYFRNEKILFLHIPKTGGTSVDDYFSKKFKVELNPACLCRRLPGSSFPLEQLTYKQVMRFVKDKVRVLTVVRNPYERIVSDLFFRGKIKQDSSKDKVYSLLKKHIEENNENHCIPQYEFIQGAPNVCILHTETLTEDMRRIGYSDFNEKANVNKSKVNYYDYLNDNSIRLINSYYDKDFELFKYKKIMI